MFTEHEKNAFRAIQEAYGTSLSETLEIIKEGSYQFYEVESFEEFVDLIVGDQVPDNLVGYLDYDKLIQDLGYNGYMMTSFGIIILDWKKEWRMRKLRVAKYKRVSKKEQAIKGFSLQAQDEALNKHIEENDYILVGDYADEGITASTLNRPDLQQLLDNVRAGKIDLIIFTKLDRWFRSVAHYYKIQEILEEHNVPWRAILEDYNTETSDGKFKVNIMLSVAQQELDRTSERIKVVFESKIKNKQPITASLPYGYKIGVVAGKKRVVKDELAEEAIFDFFAYFEIHQSLGATMSFINDKYDLHLSYNTCKSMIRNSLYAGVYHEVPEYCQPYISLERFNKIQQIIKNNKQVKQYKNTYLFSGMLKCKECGGTIVGCASKGTHDTYFYYRCSKATRDRSCSNVTRIKELQVEKYLLAHIEEKLSEYIVESEVKNMPAQKPKYSRSKIQAEIERLNKMYQKGRIEDDDYDAEYDKLQAKLDMCDLEPQQRDLKPLKEFLASDFKMIYEYLSKEEKRAMWRSIISRMTFNDYNDIDIKFL